MLAFSTLVGPPWPVVDGGDGDGMVVGGDGVVVGGDGDGMVVGGDGMVVGMGWWCYDGEGLEV